LILGASTLVAALVSTTLKKLPELGFSSQFIDSVALALAILSGVIFAIVVAYQDHIEQEGRRKTIDEVAEQARAHPEKPQLAWDLARTKLESYLGFILYGLLQAFQSPDKLPVAIVASASGVLVSFIGGSFLLIYRSILAQSKDYVTVLERINAVGMAVQVISNIPDTSGTLRDQTTAELAKQLLGLYGSSAIPAKAVTKRVAAKPKTDL
jgi:Na+/H+-dicarboxylate symporter